MKVSYEKIQLVMARKGLSAGDVAQRAGITHGTLSTNLRRIRGGSDMRPKTAAKIAKGLGVKVEQLLEAAS